MHSKRDLSPDESLSADDRACTVPFQRQLHVISVRYEGKFVKRALEKTCELYVCLFAVVNCV